MTCENLAQSSLNNALPKVDLNALHCLIRMPDSVSVMFRVSMICWRYRLLGCPFFLFVKNICHILFYLGHFFFKIRSKKDNFFFFLGDAGKKKNSFHPHPWSYQEDRIRSWQQTFGCKFVKLAYHNRRSQTTNQQGLATEHPDQIIYTDVRRQMIKGQRLMTFKVSNYAEFVVNYINNHNNKYVWSLCCPPLQVYKRSVIP